MTMRFQSLTLCTKESSWPFSTSFVLPESRWARFSPMHTIEFRPASCACLTWMVNTSLLPVYWNHTVLIFLSVYILNLLIFRSFKGSLPMLWLLVLFVLFVFMIYHIPGVGIGTTYRRGFFKFLPLFIFVLSQIPLVTWLSSRIVAWESR